MVRGSPPPEAVTELRRTTDLALKATKQTAAAIGRSMAAMVATERHLLVNLADIGEKEKRFLIYFLCKASVCVSDPGSNPVRSDSFSHGPNVCVKWSTDVIWIIELTGMLGKLY